MKTKNVIYLLIPILFSSCFGEKKVNINISGTIYKEGTTEIVPNATVYLLEDGETTWRFLNAFTTTSDDKGRYIFSFEGIFSKYTDTYAVICIKDGIKSIYKENEIGASEAYSNKVVKDLKMPAKKILKLQVVNKNKIPEKLGIQLIDYWNSVEYDNATTDYYYNKMQTTYGQVAMGSEIDTIFYLPISSYTKSIAYKFYLNDDKYTVKLMEDYSPIPYIGDTLYYKFEY